MNASKHLVNLVALRRAGLAISPLVHNRLCHRGSLLFGRSCAIAGGTLLVTETNSRRCGCIILGNGVVIGDYCNIRASTSVIKIGNDVQIAQFVNLIGTNHSRTSDGRVARDYAGKAGITIGDRCWLGVQSTLLPGVELGTDCIVGAGAVVTRSWPSFSTLGGVPARRISGSAESTV